MREYFKRTGLRSVVILSILSALFLPKGVSRWCIITFFGIWCVSKLVRYCLNHKEIFKINVIKEISALIKSSKPDSQESNISKYLVVQLSHRVTDRLHSIYPESTWDWTDIPTIDTFANGGKLRIKTANTGEFNEAEVIIDMLGRIEVNLLAISSVGEISKNEYGVADHAHTFDLKTWYEGRASKYLTELIVELNSKGTKTITIGEDGSIKIDNGMEVGTLCDFPKKNLWTQLIGLLEEDELKAVELGDAIQVGW